MKGPSIGEKPSQEESCLAIEVEIRVEQPKADVIDTRRDVIDAGRLVVETQLDVVEAKGELVNAEGRVTIRARLY